MTPAVSVLMSVYNGERYLAAAVNSILNQTFGDFEFIVVDDGSTDRSAAMLERLAAGDSRLRVVTQPNAGLTASLNTAARMARAPLLARMDPDDIAMPMRLAAQVAYLSANRHVTALGTRVVLIDPYNTPIGRPQHPLKHADIDADLLRGEGWAIVHPTAVFRREAFERVGGYDERFRTSQDFDLWLRMAETGRLANLEAPLLQYRQHLGSANFAKADQQQALKIKILSEAHRRRGLPPLDAATLAPPPLSKPFESRRRWGWAAVKERRMPAARRHAIRNLRERPTAIEMWKMLFCTVRGY